MTLYATPGDIEALKALMASDDEDMRLPGDTVRALEQSGLVVVRGCSDGDYVELTDKGRAAVSVGTET